MAILFSDSQAPAADFGRVKIYEQFAFSHKDVDRVCDNLRDEDLFELSCTDNTPADAAQLAKNASDTYLVELDGAPVFVGGIHRVEQHLGFVFGFGTEKTTRIIPQTTRYIRGTWLPWAFQRGTRRLEVRVPMRSQNSIMWLESLGFKVECALPGYSVNNEPHFQLALTRGSYVPIQGS